MAQQVGKKHPRKGKPTYITSILMVSLVLFILGLGGMIGLQFKELSTVVREQIRISVFMKDATKEVDILQLQKKLETEPFVKSTKYVSKEEAKDRFLQMSEAEEDFEGLIGYNPLPASINMYLQADYSNPDSLAHIRSVLEDKYQLNPQQLKVNEALVESINTNMQVVGAILLGICILLLIITFVLIDSTVRLAMYSNRFLLKNMQMVGADRWFITRPYLFRSIVNGFISAIIAIIALVGFMTLAYEQVPDLKQLQDPVDWGILFGIILLIGLAISIWSTHRAVTKYLKMKLEELY